MGSVGGKGEFQWKTVPTWCALTTLVKNFGDEILGCFQKNLVVEWSLDTKHSLQDPITYTNQKLIDVIKLRDWDYRVQCLWGRDVTNSDH